jgi:hypothetical protein
VPQNQFGVAFRGDQSSSPSGSVIFCLESIHTLLFNSSFWGALADCCATNLIRIALNAALSQAKTKPIRQSIIEWRYFGGTADNGSSFHFLIVCDNNPEYLFRDVFVNMLLVSEIRSGSYQMNRLDSEKELPILIPQEARKSIASLHSLQIPGPET